MNSPPVLPPPLSPHATPMDSRFRVRFWPRRARPASTELDLHSVPYQDALEGHRQPVFIHQPLGRNLSEKRKQNDHLAFRGLSYRKSTAGKPPVFGERPHKGNGPVKLNASRSEGSGDVFITTDDHARILEDIRDGEYVVAGKDKRDSRSLAVKSPAPGERRQSHSSVAGGSPSQRHPPMSTPASWAPFQTSSPLLDIPENGAENLAAQNPAMPMSNTAFSLSDVFGRPSSTQSSPPTDGLGISDFPQTPHGILKATPSHTSLVEPTTEQNATIRALWKAEYKQLVAIYGQTGVSKNIGDVPWEQKRLSTIQDVALAEEKSIPFALDPLPRPSYEHREGNTARRTSRQSKAEAAQQDDTSDESSQQRLSFISSAGYASSYTTRASIAESDSINAKEDIRKFVETMRSTYLQAIESREPSLQAVKTLKKKKKRTSTTPQSTPKGSSIPTTPENEPSAFTSANGSSPSLRSQRSTRVISQPVATISTLPAIQASPTRDKKPGPGLMRADSSTLGNLMGETKRSMIQKRRSERESRRNSQNSRSQKRSSISEKQPIPDKENLPVQDQQPIEEEFASLYRDIFNNSGHDFWDSSPALTTTVGVRAILEPSSASDAASSDSATPTQTVSQTP